MQETAGVSARFFARRTGPVLHLVFEKRSAAPSTTGSGSSKDRRILGTPGSAYTKRESPPAVVLLHGFAAHNGSAQRTGSALRDSHASERAGRFRHRSRRAETPHRIRLI